MITILLLLANHAAQAVGETLDQIYFLRNVTNDGAPLGLRIVFAPPKSNGWPRNYYSIEDLEPCAGFNLTTSDNNTLTCAVAPPIDHTSVITWKSLVNEPGIFCGRNLLATFLPVIADASHEWNFNDTEVTQAMIDVTFNYLKNSNCSLDLYYNERPASSSVAKSGFPIILIGFIAGAVALTLAIIFFLVRCTMKNAAIQNSEQQALLPHDKKTPQSVITAARMSILKLINPYRTQPKNDIDAVEKAIKSVHL